MNIDQTALTYIIGLGTVLSFILLGIIQFVSLKKRGEVNDACPLMKDCRH